MIGQKIGRWTIMGEFRKGRFLYYECRCDCGTVRNVKANSIRCGRSKSCGCCGAIVRWTSFPKTRKSGSRPTRRFARILTQSKEQNPIKTTRAVTRVCIGRSKKAFGGLLSTFKRNASTSAAITTFARRSKPARMPKRNTFCH